MSGEKWSKEEIEVLREKYPSKSARELTKTLNRSKNAIHLKASELNIRSDREWYAREIEFLEKNYGIRSIPKIAEKLDRSEKSVREKIQSLGLTPKELNKDGREKIEELYEKGKDVKFIAKEMGLSLGLIMEILYPREELKRLYIKKGLLQREIADRLGVAQSYISKRMRNLGIKTNAKKAWTSKEEKILKENYLKISKEELMNLLSDRSWKAIKCKARKLGVARSMEEYRNSEDLKNRLRSYAEENTIKVDFSKKRILSYILGVIDGDGSHDKKYTIGLEVKSAEFADKFYKALQKIGLRPGRGTRSNRERETVWASSVQLVKWYMKMDYERRLEWLESDERGWKYIEGRYESDGNLSKGTARICSYDDRAKKFLSDLLKSLDIGCSIQQNNVYVYKAYADNFFNNINPVIRNPS